MPYTWDTLRDYSSSTALLLELIRIGASSEQAMSLVKSNILERLTIKDMVSQIEEIKKDRRWFIDLEEITAFPQILEKWYKLYCIEKLLRK